MFNEGKPKSSAYAHIEALIGDFGLPSADWFQRIESTVGEYVDLKLYARSDVIADCLLYAYHVVQQFSLCSNCTGVKEGGKLSIAFQNGREGTGGVASDGIGTTCD